MSCNSDARITAAVTYGKEQSCSKILDLFLKLLMTFKLGYTFTGSMGKQIDVSMWSSALRESLAMVDEVEDAAGEEQFSFQKKSLMI